MDLKIESVLLYATAGLSAILLILVIALLAIQLDLSSRFNKFSTTADKDIESLKMTTSNLGTILNAHLSDYSELKTQSGRHEQQLAYHTEEIGILSKNVSTLQGNFSEFRSSYIDLKDKYTNLKDKYTDLKDKYTDLKNYSESLKRELDNFETTLMAKWQWIRDNAKMDATEADKIDSQLDKYCGPDIKLPCIPAVLVMKEKYSYIDEYGDQIKPIKDFVAERGGDCEDWSLFMKAYINSKPDNKLIRAYEKGGTEDYTIYEDENKIYYYSNSRDVKIGKKGSLETIVICYDAGTEGHCILAFANKTTENSVFQKLDTAIAVEPQNGKVVGHTYNVNDGSDRLYLSSQGSDLPIYIIITDDDLFLYEDKYWNSYEIQYTKFEAIKNPH